MRAIPELGMHHQATHQVDHRYHFIGPVSGGGVRVHVFEFICGGGLVGLPLPAPMAREGDLMLGALVEDLLEMADMRVSFSRDERLTPPACSLRGARVCWRGPDVPSQEALEREITSCDAVWPIAPETDGELERATRAVLDAGRLLLGSDPDAVALAGSKFATAQRLAEADIDVIACFRPGSAWATIDGPWVLKPDDGAGSAGTRVFGRREEAAGAAQAATADGTQRLIAQPWIDGEAMSLCVLAAPGRTEVLSVNRQQVRLHDGAVELAAIEVNCEPVNAQLVRMAERVAAAIPGLRGYFGIDFIRTVTGAVVIEVNPRLTTSYAGLRPALGLNVAEWVMAAATGRSLPPARSPRSCAVTLKLDGDATG
jgi:predicted ATP-grasp superfamily ATP-dependent carboligase